MMHLYKIVYQHYFAISQFKIRIPLVFNGLSKNEVSGDCQNGTIIENKSHLFIRRLYPNLFQYSIILKFCMLK